MVNSEILDYFVASITFLIFFFCIKNAFYFIIIFSICFCIFKLEYMSLMQVFSSFTEPEISKCNNTYIH